MSAYFKGRLNWGVNRDIEGHRDYTLQSLVLTTDTNDGPSTVMLASGLPLVGSLWNIGGNDLDLWAFCTPEMKITPLVAKEKGIWWIVDQKFTTRPLNRCQDDTIEDPLAEPAQLSGSFVRYTEISTKDKNDDSIKSSAHTPLQVEFDANRPTVNVKINTLSLGLSTFAPMIDTVNQFGMWGLGPRMIKLSNVSWERHMYGTCNFYYSREFQFDINYNTFDVKADDISKMVLKGSWNVAGDTWTVDPAADPLNPQHFVRYKDKNEENAVAFLNGSGSPATDYDDVKVFTIQKYTESSFLTLGIPSTL